MLYLRTVMRSSSWPLFLLGLSMLWACSTPEDEPPIGEAIPAEPLFILLEAYRGSEQYFLRYRRGEKVYYAAGDLRGAVAQPARENYDLPRVTSMDQQREGSWHKLTRNLTPVPILTVADWAVLRHQLFADLMPGGENQGIVISFDRADYFFFYDKTGAFRARRLIDKPADYSVSTRIDLNQHFEAWQPVLLKFLSDAGIESEDVIFSTGDLDRGAIPFLYINTRSRLIVLVQDGVLPGGVAGAVPGSHVLQTVWHFLESNSYTILVRPFSSIKRLLAVVTDTAAETGRLLASDLQFEGPVPALSEGPTMDLLLWERDLDAKLERPASRGTLDFLVDGDTFFPRFIDTVASAQESIDIRTYIFDNDDVALEIGELLKRRSREGVDVKVLVDGMGSIAASGERSSTLPEGHRGPASIRNFLEQDSRVKVRLAKNPWFTGDHVKTMVIDQKIAFLGGMNIGREYRYDWHDLMVEVTGQVVDEINSEFGKAWGQAGMLGDFSALFFRSARHNTGDDSGYPVRLIHTRPGNYEIFRLQKEAIRRARRYIYVENAYFTDDSLLRELVLARRRGVDVRVIFPLETDRGFITRSMVLAANVLWRNGVRVYIYPGFSHAKAAIFDGWVSVGSANLDRLSLRINKEINIATSDPRAAAALSEKLFARDFQLSTELTQPIPERWTDYIIEMFGDYIF